MRRPPLALVVGLVLACCLRAAEVHAEPARAHLSPGHLELDAQWRFRAGDDPAWADPSYDDRRWSLAPSELAEPVAGFESVGWFRQRVTRAAALSPHLAARIQHICRLRIYVDGRLVLVLGPEHAGRRDGSGANYDPIHRPLHLEGDGPHLLAVRCEVPAWRDAQRELGMAGFVLRPTSLDDALVSTAKLERRKSFDGAIVGVLAAFTLLHLLMFAFRRDQSENLWFGLLAGTLFLLFATNTWVPITEAEALLTTLKVIAVANVVVAISLQRTFYALAGRVPGPFAKVVTWAGVAIAAFAWILPHIASAAIVVVALVDSARVVAIAVVRKHEGIGWVVAGMALFLVGTAARMHSIVVRPEDTGLGVPFALGMFGLMATISWHNVRSFARTHRHLDESRATVRDLTEEKVQAAVDRVRLEQENLRNAQALADAEKLAAAHRELSDKHDELLATQGQLIHSEKMAALGMLVAGIAHEINTPVGAIASTSDTLAAAQGKLRRSLEQQPGALEAEGVGKTLAVMEQASGLLKMAAQRVTEIVTRLRSFARLDEAELKKADIHRGIEDTLAVVAHRLGNVRVEKDYGDLPEIACYPGQLNQVVLNLLVNAQQAIGDRGTIVVKTRHENGRVIISVTDDGCGIAPDHLSRIFDPGFTTKGVKVGTGLGLSICDRIIKAHSGEITVTSELGRGTTFTVSIPDAHDVPSPATRSS
ncbi:MAG: hypothetical protein IT379_09640 [Deltaproteobacteria bacterium]|nr:hypothetical protein [Deltaproteobacteria bacterium]